MFNGEHSTLNDSSSCSDPPKCFVTFRSIDHCHSSRHSKQNQISGDLIYLALIFAPVYVGFQRGSTSHAHFAHFILIPHGILCNIWHICEYVHRKKTTLHKVYISSRLLPSETPAIHRPTIPTNSSCSYFSYHHDFQVHHVRI